MALGMSLKTVLEALKQEPNSKMYMFGLAALDRFRSRLKDCAQYCQHIYNIPHFSAFPPQLAEVCINKVLLFIWSCLPIEW